MRLVDADEVGKYLYEHLDDLHMISAQNAIDEMPTIEPVMNDWVKCSERIPEEHEDVLVAMKDGEYKSIHVGYAYNGGDWMIDGEFWYEEGDPSITHWMPLPELPKEVKKMAIARKCDRCGTLYEPYRTAVKRLNGRSYANGFTFAERNLGGLDAFSENNCRDLCPDCFESLLAWFWEKMEAEDDA